MEKLQTRKRTSMNNDYRVTKDFIEITIRKPLGDGFCFIRDKYIKDASRTGKMLKIKLPDGEAVVSADTWMSGAKKVEKVFKIPSRPMVLYGNYAPIVKVEKMREHKNKEVVISEDQGKLF